MSSAVHRRSWPYARTPLAVYLLVMGPINAFMLFLVLGKPWAWMKWTAIAVLAFTLFGLCKGYGRRLVLTREAARLARLGSTIEIPWPKVRRVGVYSPDLGSGGTDYVYITTGEGEPEGKWDISADTIQVQNRDGLIEAIEKERDAALG